MVERLTGCMTKYFGFSSFRTGQKEAASSALHGRDVFVRMATGGGKSLSMFLVPLTYAFMLNSRNGPLGEHMRLAAGMIPCITLITIIKGTNFCDSEKSAKFKDRKIYAACASGASMRTFRAR